jgi:hypothetical protein
MYDAHLITCNCELYYLVKVQNYTNSMFIYFSHHHLHTFTLQVGHHRGPQNPHRSIHLKNLPPILGGVPSLTNSLTQPSHTPVSDTILGLALLGSTFLGSNSQGHPSTSSPSQGGGGQNPSQGRSTTPPNLSQGLVLMHTHTMAGTNTPPNPPMTYLVSLNIPDLTKLTNDPILHDPTWTNMPTKLPSDIPKFKGKSGEDLSNHVMTFHLWFSSNNIMDESILLRLFQRKLIGPSAKWYVEEKSGSHVTFESLVKSFMAFFQLRVGHDTGLELISK